jgi:peptide deformylase
VDETATLVQARIDHRTAVRFIDRIQASVPNHKFCKKITQAGSVAC